MKIPKDISNQIRRHLENEIDAGRRFAPLAPVVVSEFMASPEEEEAPPEAPVNIGAEAGPFDSPMSPSRAGADADKPFIETLEGIAEGVASCTACRLAESRTKTVPGAGNGSTPDIMFIGEGPGRDEDEQGIPFVGRAGQLLTKMIAAMGCNRDEVFIANVVKCRPPNNRVPEDDEMAACLPWLLRQIEIVKPKTIVTLGATALKGLTGRTDVLISKERGVWNKFNGIPLMPTFHPSYLMRYPPAKVEAWKDLKAVLKLLGKTPPQQEAKENKQ